MSITATFKTVAMRKQGAASQSSNNNAQAGAPAMNAQQTGGAMKPSSKNYNEGGSGNYRQKSSHHVVTNVGVSLSRPSMLMGGA